MRRLNTLGRMRIRTRVRVRIRSCVCVFTCVRIHLHSLVCAFSLPHCRWVGLVDPTNGKDRGLQGYLRLSVSVLGPGDKLYIPSDAAASSVATLPPGEKASAGAGATASGGGKGALWDSVRGKKKATMDVLRKADGELADADEEVAAAALVLLPPSISRKTRWLVVTCHAAEGLPAMDEEGALGLFSAGIDAYAEVTFAGNPPARTHWITKLGRDNLGVEWNRELWLPFNSPNFTNRIEVAAFDFDRFKENDRVGMSTCNTHWY